LAGRSNHPYTDRSQAGNAPRLCWNLDAEANTLEIVAESGASARADSGIRARYAIACAGAEPVEPAENAPPAEAEPAEPTGEGEDPGRRGLGQESERTLRERVSDRDSKKRNGFRLARAATA